MAPEAGPACCGGAATAVPLQVYTGMYGDRADVWSWLSSIDWGFCRDGPFERSNDLRIGVILFEMLSNRHPFYTSGNDLEAAARTQRVSSEAPSPPPPPFEVKRRILSPEGADFCDPSWGEAERAGRGFAAWQASKTRR